MCSDCEVYGLKKHGLTRSDFITYRNNTQYLQTLNTVRIRHSNNPKEIKKKTLSSYLR